MGTTTVSDEGGKALVIGVGQYKRWPQHPHAVRNARDVSRSLQRLGFSATLLINPTFEKLRSALDAWSGDMGAQDLLFYYSGHSHTATSEEGKSVGWLIPVDAPMPEKGMAGFKARAVSTDEMGVVAGRMKSRQALFLFDACISGRQFEKEPALMRIISKNSNLPVGQFIAACEAGEENKDRNLFTRYLLKGLSGEADLIHDKVISGSELGLYLRERVAKVSGGRLNPQFGKVAMAGNGGDFLFQLKNLSPKVPKMASLFVKTQPDWATTRIINIQPPFRQGMELEPGRYDLKVTAKGFVTVRRSIDLKAGEHRTEKIGMAEIQIAMVDKPPVEIEKKAPPAKQIGMRFSRINPGKFLMGSPVTESGRSNDEDQHSVSLTRSYRMQRTEVTVAQFRQFVDATGYVTDAEKGGGCWTMGAGSMWTKKANTSWKAPGGVKIKNDWPVICVSWNDARAFAQWLSDRDRRTYRLPTEAEWEYACRAGRNGPFSTGDCLATDNANYGKTGHSYQKCDAVFRKFRGHPLKAGSLSPNPWRLHNLHGNVAEWCQDWYGSYPSGSVTDPKGPQGGSERVLRGGHWQADASGCRSAARRPFPPNFASDVVGFRLVAIP